MTRISSIEAARCGIDGGRPLRIGEMTVRIGRLQRKNLKARARAFHTAGQSVEQISEALKISPPTIRQWLQEEKT